MLPLWALAPEEPCHFGLAGLQPELVRLTAPCMARSVVPHVLSPALISLQIGLCEDAAVLGTPFYLMEHVKGRIFTDPSLPDMEPGQRAAVYGVRVRGLLTVLWVWLVCRSQVHVRLRVWLVWGGGGRQGRTWFALGVTPPVSACHCNCAA
jgi:hypothetical protein